MQRAELGWSPEVTLLSLFVEFSQILKRDFERFRIEYAGGIVSAGHVVRNVPVFGDSSHLCAAILSIRGE